MNAITNPIRLRLAPRSPAYWHVGVVVFDTTVGAGGRVRASDRKLRSPHQHWQFTGVRLAKDI